MVVSIGKMREVASSESYCMFLKNSFLFFMKWSVLLDLYQLDVTEPLRAEARGTMIFTIRIYWATPCWSPRNHDLYYTDLLSHSVLKPEPWSLLYGFHLLASAHLRGISERCLDRLNFLCTSTASTHSDTLGSLILRSVTIQVRPTSMIGVLEK